MVSFDDKLELFRLTDFYAIFTPFWHGNMCFYIDPYRIRLAKIPGFMRFYRPLQNLIEL